MEQKIKIALGLGLIGLAYYLYTYKPAKKNVSGNSISLFR